MELTRQRQLPFIALALGIEDEKIPAIGIDNLARAELRLRGICWSSGTAISRDPIVRRCRWPCRAEEEEVAPARVDPEMEATPRDRMHGYWQALAEYGIRKSRARWSAR